MRVRRFALSARVGTALLPPLLVLAALPGGIARAGTASASAASPTVTGPVGGGTPAEFMFSTNFNLASVGYQEQEFFLSGTATSYTSTSLLTTDGKWNGITAHDAAPYTTRAIVRRPIDPEEFNGTVIVEWLNVSGAVDAGPDWTLSHNELVRDGFAWVGVSAQWQGVQAAKGNAPLVVPGDPVRYAPLSHPGDSYSYDMFSQAGQAIRDSSELMLDGLTPRRLIAVGESQSAGRLVTYINAIQPRDHEYNGFLVHSRGGGGAPLRQIAPGTPIPATPNDGVPGVAAGGTKFRDDLTEPVFVFETETDMFNSNLTVRQADTNLFRLWEVAGSSHFDWYGLGIGPADTGNGQGAVLNLGAELSPPNDDGSGRFNCTLAMNTGGTHWVLDAAIYWTNRWVKRGTPPPIGQRLQTTQVSPVVFAKDTNGNTAGGVRSPQVDAPVAALGGIGNTPAFCTLFGTTVPFTQNQLAALYATHEKFVMRWAHAAHQDVKGGFLLRADAEELIDSAASSNIGS
jgi:hypothetical protein